MEFHNKLVDILTKGISLTEEEIQELNLYFNIFDIIEKEKIAFGNFLLSNLRSNQMDQVGDWDLRNHEYFRKIGICESIKRMYQNQQDINVALVYYIEGDGYQSEFPNRWSDAIKRAKEISKEPKCHYVGISNTVKMTVFFSTQEFTEMAKYYNGWFQTEKDHETFIESVYDCFKTKRPQTFEFNKINQNMNQSNSQDIDIFYKAAKFAAQEGLIKSLIPDGDDEFHFYHKKDKCQVTIFEENGLVAIIQDYSDGNSPDVDDISLSGFKKYLEIEDIYQDIDVYKNTMFHEMPFGFADGGIVGQSKLNQAKTDKWESWFNNLSVDERHNLWVDEDKLDKSSPYGEVYDGFIEDEYQYLPVNLQWDVEEYYNDNINQNLNQASLSPDLFFKNLILNNLDLLKMDRSERDAKVDAICGSKFEITKKQKIKNRLSSLISNISENRHNDIVFDDEEWEMIKNAFNGNLNQSKIQMSHNHIWDNMPTYNREKLLSKIGNDGNVKLSLIELENSGINMDYFLELLEKYTKNNYKLDQAKLKQIELPNCNITVLGFGNDINGNKVIKLKYPNPNYSAFSFQVGSFDDLRFMSRFDLNDVENDPEKVEKALVSVIRQFGSKKQKEGLRTYTGFNESYSLKNQSVWEKNGFVEFKRESPQEFKDVEWSYDGHSSYFIGHYYYQKGTGFMFIQKMDGTIVTPKSSNKLFWRPISSTNQKLNQSESNQSKSLDESLSKDQLKSIDNFLAKYPDNATSWRQATDEIVTLYNHLKEEYNDITEKDLDVIDPSNTKTSDGRNKEYKKGIYFFLELMKKDQEFERILSKFYKDWKHWFGVNENLNQSGDSITSEYLNELEYAWTADVKLNNDQIISIWYTAWPSTRNTVKEIINVRIDEPKRKIKPWKEIIGSKKKMNESESDKDFKTRCENDSLKIAKLYQTWMKSNLDDDFEDYEYFVEKSGIPDRELNKITSVVIKTDGNFRPIDVYNYWPKP